MLFKISFYINIIAVVAILLLYAIFGMKALSGQFVLGCFQILIAIIITVTKMISKNKYNTESKHLLRYWISVGVWFIMLKTLYRSNSLVIETIIISVIPMLIACYFTYTTYLIHKQDHEL